MKLSMVRRFLAPSVLLALGFALTFASVMRADWPAGQGGTPKKHYCVTQGSGCFSAPSCLSCSSGPNEWKTCGSTVWLSCRQTDSRVYGDCSGTNPANITCYTWFSCALVTVYQAATCVTDACTWDVWFGPDTCDPFNP
jgi:hypothetical protein